MALEDVGKVLDFLEVGVLLHDAGKLGCKWLHGELLLDAVHDVHALSE